MIQSTFMQIKKVSAKEIDKVVFIHKASFRNFFLTELGDRFLSVYYSSIQKSEEGYLLGVYNNNELQGFCAATQRSSGFNQRLVKKNLARFLFVGMMILCTKPGSLIRLGKNFTKKSDAVDDNGDYAELLSIAVGPDKQGLGLGEKLLRALEDLLCKDRVKNLSLTTDFYDNKKAILFYGKLGYTIMYEFMAYPKRKMYRMIKAIASVRQ